MNSFNRNFPGRLDVLPISLSYKIKTRISSQLFKCCLFQGQGVPKVIVMGSSSASETTINTSTDSSNTIVTTVTATDGDVTEDSLDLTDPMDFISADILDNSHMSNTVLQVNPTLVESDISIYSNSHTAENWYL